MYGLRAHPRSSAQESRLASLIFPPRGGSPQPRVVWPAQAVVAEDGAEQRLAAPTVAVHLPGAFDDGRGIGAFLRHLAEDRPLLFCRGGRVRIPRQRLRPCRRALRPNRGTRHRRRRRRLSRSLIDILPRPCKARADAPKASVSRFVSQRCLALLRFGIRLCADDVRVREQRNRSRHGGRDPHRQRCQQGIQAPWNVSLQ